VILERFYSQSTGATYLAGLHTHIPADAVLITESRYNEVIRDADPLKVRGHDEEGLPILIDPPPPSPEQVAAIERMWRDNQLNTSQWLVARYSEETSLGMATSNTAEQFAELLEYRQHLRDWPASESFPNAEERPRPPAWIADQI